MSVLANTQSATSQRLYSRRHIIDSFRSDIKSSSFQRLRTDMKIASGIPKFCPLEMIQQERNPYVRDDSMFIKIMVDFGDTPNTLFPYIVSLNPGLPVHVQQDCWNRVKRKVPARRTVARFSFALLLLWLCHQRVVKLGFIQMTHHGFALSDNVATTYSSIHYDPLKANLGLIFFRHLIHDSDSHEHVNDENLCSLIHFFIQQATLNKRPVQFSTGIFILYDSTGRFFPRLMMAKNAQIHSDEHRSGYMLRLKHFALDAILSIRERFLGRRYSNALPFIYLRGDESSHFHERGTKYERRHVYPA
ncbi:unnamed protein product [Rotaria magnacalcarata]|uniref:TRAF1-6 MATH domain-containing protein n=2 Tax=Rotaria magnacalcarata TaxID=392030 RepID=A0A8S2RG17_9BILA|nr:unnamed protein product [Rotaria magnacalcarata]